MAEVAWLDENYYLALKVKQLKIVEGKDMTIPELKRAIADAGLTVEEHYLRHGRGEKLSPNPYFNETEYLAGKLAQLKSTEPTKNWTLDKLTAAIAEAGLTPVEHYERYGMWEQDKDGLFINPSNAFDANAYYSAKLAEMQGAKPTATLQDLVEALKTDGMSPISHYMAYGKGESERAGIAMLQLVPQGQRLANDEQRVKLGETLPASWNPDTSAPTDQGHSARDPLDAASLKPEDRPGINTPIPGDSDYSPPETEPVWGELQYGIITTGTQSTLYFDPKVTGVIDVEVYLEPLRGWFIHENDRAYMPFAQRFTAIQLAEGQSLRMDEFNEVAAFFGSAGGKAPFAFTGKGNVVFDAAAMNVSKFFEFGKLEGEGGGLGLSSTDSANTIVFTGLKHVDNGFTGKVIMEYNAGHQFTQDETEFLLGPSAAGTAKHFQKDHVSGYEYITDYVINKGTLVATGAQANLLQGDLVVSGDGGVTIIANAEPGKNDMGKNIVLEQQFHIASTGTNVIAGGGGADDITLGVTKDAKGAITGHTGKDVLLFTPGDSGLDKDGNAYSAGWDTIRNFDVKNDKIVFAEGFGYKQEGGRNTGPLLPVGLQEKLTIASGKGDIGDGTAFVYNNGLITDKTAPSGKIDDKQAATSLDALLTALDTAIGSQAKDADASSPVANGNLGGIKATLTSPAAGSEAGHAFAASDVWAYQQGEGDSARTFILKADGEAGHDGDFVIELVGVTDLNATTLVGMLSAMPGNIDWGK
jgi:hypothetical protein